LRAASTNTVLLNATAALAPKNLKVIVYTSLADLPHFNPDLDNDTPKAVKDFRSQLAKSAGVIISSPEYAHGVPGVLKNALDWLVASGELYEKPVALFSASPWARFAHASLTETLKVMMARVFSEASINSLPTLMEHGERHSSPNIELPVRVERAVALFVNAIDPERSKSARKGERNDKL